MDKMRGPLRSHNDTKTLRKKTLFTSFALFLALFDPLFVADVFVPSELQHRRMAWGVQWGKKKTAGHPICGSVTPETAVKLFQSWPACRTWKCNRKVGHGGPGQNSRESMATPCHTLTSSNGDRCLHPLQTTAHCSPQCSP
jgi:hypothetical protein